MAGGLLEKSKEGDAKDGDFLHLRGRKLSRTPPAEAKNRKRRSGGSSKAEKGGPRKSRKGPKGVVANGEEVKLEENAEGLDFHGGASSAAGVNGVADDVDGTLAAIAKPGDAIAEINGVSDDFDGALATIEKVGGALAATDAVAAVAVTNGSGGSGESAVSAAAIVNGGVGDSANAANAGGCNGTAANSGDSDALPIDVVEEVPIKTAGLADVLGKPIAVNKANGGADDKEEEEKEAFLAQLVLALEASDRGSRECTPEHLIMQAEDIPFPKTPDRGAARRAGLVANEPLVTRVSSNMPPPDKIEAFFTYAENDNNQNLTALERYNFDFENDQPLPGRFEWEKIDP